MRRDRRTREQRKADASARIAAVCLFLAALLILFAVLTVKTTGQPYKGEPPVIEDKLFGEDEPAEGCAVLDIGEPLGEFIDVYFKKCEGEPFIGDDGCAVRDKYGVPVIINAKPPTITGLALALGFTGRQALLDYQARPEFADTVTRAKSRCEEYAESRLYDKDGANGAKFSLGCNFGWREVNETKISTDSVKVVIDV